MPVEKLKGLQGLKGLGGLSKAQYDNFITSNKDLVAQHGYDPMYINNLYSNKQFIDKYGVEKFKAIPDIDMRNALFKEDLVNTEFDKLYKPSKTNVGLGNDYGKYNQLSVEGKLKLMESNYLTPTELDKKVDRELLEDKRRIPQLKGGTDASMSFGDFLRAFGSAATKNPNTPAMERNLQTDEMKRQIAREQNQKILDKIYNDDVDAAASKYGTEVSQAYNDVYLANMSDSQIKEAFVQAITPGSYKDKNGIPNMGIAEYASHYGKGSRNDITSEMENFSIDDMRKVLAKKQVYDTFMSPEMAATALNNEAKRYIKEHQGSMKRFGLFAKDVGISALSYTADKMNGIAELYRMGQDKFAEKPIVMVDDRGNVLDPNSVKVVRDKQGNLHYQDGEGKLHSVHQEQIDYTTLHNMGKNPDGSDIKGAFGVDWMTLNPQYWTKAEQFGTLDENEQKQYEKLGSSPYKVAYNPNEDGDLWYEAFKMMSFGIADAASQLIPYGVGTLGRTLSTASKVGKVARGFGKVLDATGKMLTAETKMGQVAQGTAGALGIAYAYNRGAFQETLAQNLANAEEAVTNASKNDIYNQYHSNKKYKTQVDKLINERAAGLKANYIAQMQREGGMKIADEKALDKMLHAKAQDAVLNELVQNKIKERMASKDYANLQQEAINSAGDAAFNTYLPEAIKYGFVNNLGYRKFLYTNPSGLSKKMLTSLKGLKEITTDAGRRRMATETSKFLTRGDKWKEFGKTLASQTWGGAWTNGTDDMQVDAAERINNDSYNRYLQAYQNGEALADTYGFLDGMYSYMKGLGNSMGQESTWNSAAVGGLGSIVNFTPNFANISRLATKEGREAYRNAFRKEVVRDKDGMPLKNEDGSIKTQDLGRMNDWRGQLNYFIQNGVLNNYYAKKQAEKELQSHADYVNNLLDQYNDFVDIEKLVASNVASKNLENVGDQKTMDFVRALHAVNTLDKLGKDSNDPTTMSSVVQNAKQLIEKASQLNNENGENPFSEEEINNLLSTYYASNPDLEQSDANNQKALYDIAQNAQKLQEASEAYNKAEQEIQKIERNRKEAIDPIVRETMKEKQALNQHWEERRSKMQSEIDDTSTDDSSLDGDATTVIATVGGMKNAQSLIKVYDRQQSEIEKELEEQKKKSDKLGQQVTEAAKVLRNDNLESDARYQAEQKLRNAQAEESSSKEQENYLEGMLSRTVNKRNTLQHSIDSMHEEQKEGSANHKEKVLTADEIFSLDPVTRARMLKEDNRSLYSKEQQREIEKLEQRLLMRDADALQKVQDIALLTQRINANQDAYSRMAKNPEAAAIAVEEQRVEAAKTAHKLINQRNAETFADYINQFDESMKNHPDVSEDSKNQVVFKQLRKLNTDMLDVLDKDGLLPQYQQQIHDAKEWTKTVEDIAAVIEGSNQDTTWKENVLRNIDSLVEDSNTKDEIMRKLEKVVDDTNGSVAASDLEFILEGLENLGYQRDATILEDRKKRQDREAEIRRKQDEIAKKVKTEAQEKAKATATKAADISTRLSDKELKEAKVDDLEDIDWDDSDDSSSKSNQKEESTKQESSKKNDAVDTDINTSNAQYGFSVNTKEYVKPLKVNQEETVYIGNNNADGTVSVVPVSHQRVKSVNSLGEYFDFTGGYDRQKSSSMYVIQPATVKKDGEYYKLVSKGKLAWTDKSTYNKEHSGRTLENGGHLKIQYTQVVKVSSKDYESIPETAKHEENATFDAHSAEKVKDNWYFIGNFAGSKEQTKVKAREGLDIEKLGEQQSEEGKGVAEEAMPSNMEIVNGTIEGRTPSLEEQMNDMNSNDAEDVHLSDVHEDAAELNGTGQNSIETNPITLSGNGMSRYEPRALENDGRIVLKKGEKEDDNMNKFYAWMDAAGIKLQNIIDNEMAAIIKMNPHAKVKFMGVKPEENATHDMDMFKHCMLVLDYDDKANKGITSIHNDDNGGVIESLGKKYLIIGVVGYPRNNKYKQGLWNVLWDARTKDGLRLTVDRKKFFDEHPAERFYVNEQYHTEVVPYSQIPGYIVKQMEGEEVPEARSIRELLEDKKRNPHSITMETAAWGIQEMGKFLTVNASPGNVMVPRDTYRNMGSAFVLMPASNGKLVPSYLRVLKYTEMNDGELKNEIDNLLFSVVGPNYDNAKDAIKELLKIIYLNKDGDNILRSKREVSLVHDGQVVKTFVLNDEFDRQKFMQEVGNLNPRINITARVLKDQKLLQKWDEAGALMTDAALFSTVGSSYSIYALDKSGKMMMPETPVNPTKATGTFKNDKSQVIYDHQYYTEDNGVFSLDGKTITDEKLIQQLQYNKRIIDSELTPVTSKDTLDYYVFGTGEHPEVISVDRNTKEVKALSEQKAKELIDKINEQQDKIKREKNAEKMLEEMESQTPTELEDVEGDFGIDEETGEIILEEDDQQIRRNLMKKHSTTDSTNTIEESNEDKSLADKSMENLGNKDQRSPTKKFSELVGDVKFLLKVRKLLSNKWSEAPKKVSDMEKFLRDKNVEVDAIGTSKEDIEAWLKTIEDCR